MVVLVRKAKDGESNAGYPKGKMMLSMGSGWQFLPRVLPQALS